MTRFTHLRVVVVATAATALAVFGSPVPAGADALAIDFEAPTYHTGTIDLQDGWSSFGAAGHGCAVYDHTVVSNTGAPYSYPSFGSQSLRMSNAVTSGCFGDQTFSKSLANEAGETTAEGGGLSSGPRRTHFHAEWDFASTTPTAPQPGLSVVGSPDRGDGARMSWVQMTDLADGLAVNFFDYQSGAVEAGCVTGDNFIFSPVVTGLSRTVPHHIRIDMDFVDGPKNDVVSVTVDGTATHVGTSWEDYFRECEGNPSRTVDSVLFRTGGTAAPATLGQGFVIDNLKLSTNDLTAIKAEAFVADAGPGLSASVLNVRATLTNADNGTRLAGRTVVFTAGSTTICTATTDTNGVAFCNAVAAAPAILANGGYTASFGGDANLSPSADDAPLISLNGADVP